MPTVLLLESGQFVSNFGLCSPKIEPFRTKIEAKPDLAYLARLAGVKKDLRTGCRSGGCDPGRGADGTISLDRRGTGWRRNRYDPPYPLLARDRSDQLDRRDPPPPRAY